MKQTKFVDDKAGDDAWAKNGGRYGSDGTHGKGRGEARSLGARSYFKKTTIRSMK